MANFPCIPVGADGALKPQAKCKAAEFTLPQAVDDGKTPRVKLTSKAGAVFEVRRSLTVIDKPVTPCDRADWITIASGKEDSNAPHAMRGDCNH